MITEASQILDPPDTENTTGYGIASSKLSYSQNFSSGNRSQNLGQSTSYASSLAEELPPLPHVFATDTDEGQERPRSMITSLITVEADGPPVGQRDEVEHHATKSTSSAEQQLSACPQTITKSSIPLFPSCDLWEEETELAILGLQQGNYSGSVSPNMQFWDGVGADGTSAAEFDFGVDMLGAPFGMGVNTPDWELWLSASAHPRVSD